MNRSIRERNDTSRFSLNELFYVINFFYICLFVSLYFYFAVLLDCYFQSSIDVQKSEKKILFQSFDFNQIFRFLFLMYVIVVSSANFRDQSCFVLS
jgi:hypothetical protein